MQRKTLVLSAFAIIATLCFLKLGQHPISPWDEARRAINALELLQTCDFVNASFRGKPENWDFKPPLVMWSQALSFKAFGVNEFALRLPSALPMLLSFFVLYRTIILYRSPTFAALTCLMLASVKGLIGWHAGRTGDTDAMLTLFLLVFVYFALLAIDFGKIKAAWGAGLFLGMAFLVKGPAAWVLLPGFLLYLLLTKRLKTTLSKALIWAGMILAGLFPIGWFFIQKHFGARPDGASVPVRNAFEGLFTIDLWERFAISADGAKRAFDPGFFFYSLDKIFNLWHFAFFVFLAFGLFCFAKNRAKVMAYMLAEHNRLLLVSLCLYFPLAIFLAVAAKSYRWYLTPVLPFIGIATFWGIRHFWLRQTWVKWAFLAVLAFTLSRQFALFWKVKPKPAIVFENAPLFERTDTIYQIGTHIEQDVLCYLYFFGKKMQFDTAPCPLPPRSVLFVSKVDKPGELCQNMRLVAGNGNYLIFQPK